MTRREPALYVNMYTHTRRLFWAPCSVCFTKAMSSSLVLLSATSPLQSPFKLCYVDHFPGSSSDFTRSAVLLFSLPLSPCSVSQMVLHHYLQLSSLSINASFSPQESLLLQSFPGFLSCCEVSKEAYKAQSLLVFETFLKTSLYQNAYWAMLADYVVACQTVWASIFRLLLPCLSIHTTPTHPFFSFIPLFPEINSDYKVWPAFFTIYVQYLAQCLSPILNWTQAAVWYIWC